MRELSLNILDIAENSVKAGAKNIGIGITAGGGNLTIVITDDGCGMDEETLKKVADPFTTSRTTRKVGMGIPLFKMQCEQTGGGLSIKSKKGEGTEVRALLKIDSIDREPLGDMAGTLIALICADTSIDYRFELKTEKGGYVLDTAELKKELEGVPLDTPEILAVIRRDVADGVREIAPEL